MQMQTPSSLTLLTCVGNTWYICWRSEKAILLQTARLWPTIALRIMNRFEFVYIFLISIFHLFHTRWLSRSVYHSLMIFGENKHFAIFYICRVVNEWKSVSSTWSIHNRNDRRNKRLILILQWIQTIVRRIQSLLLLNCWCSLQRHIHTTRLLSPYTVHHSQYS